MQTIGLIGGMSWESTVSYYRLVNEGVKARLGGLHSARVVLYSVDFHEIEAVQRTGDWAAAGAMMAAAAKAVEAGGADFIVLCTNTMHKVAGAMETAVSIPLLHIADPTAAAIAGQGMTCVGLLGTQFTMEQDFYRDRLTARGLTVLTPDADDRAVIHRVIYEELCLGEVRAASRGAYLRIIDDLVRRGAQGIVLGCTEIGLLIGPEATDVPLFDTTALHAQAAVEMALSDGGKS